MKALVLGASGATGTLVVKQLLKRKTPTRILVRKTAVLPKEISEDPLVETVTGNINELDQAEMDQLVQNCNIIISCLGHNISFKGMFGQPRYLVLDAIRSVCERARKNTDKRVKIILMSTTGYTNALLREKNSIGERVVNVLLMLLLPPHRDNIKAANYLINEIGTQDENIEWVAVRPDTLVDDDLESSYEVFESPVRSPIFNAGKTSRINVSHFMAELATDNNLWEKWLFKTPVVYNK
ncbi:MAG: SDR family oxidoreductase [Spirochaetia bacterium]|nr:SDR family oxidoreductase [Spirochaetia bacterium]MCF7949334.1 SDR family oxidoreductase [Spirochaetia bacterium]